MNYFLHKDFIISEKNKIRIKSYFQKIKTIETTVFLKNKSYKAIIDVESFLHLTNFDCFNCLTNCCVQFPYEFNRKSRKVILENLNDYDKLTKAVSILKEEGLTEKEIISSIKNDKMLIPEEHVETTFDRCTCSCVHIDRHLCAIHKICIDNNFSLEEIIDTKPLWCSIYPLEIIQDEEQLYIFVPTKKNNYLAMNDSDFPCMDIEKSKSPYFRRENPIGFQIEDYKPFIISYYSILKYILGEQFIDDLMKALNLTKENLDDFQYIQKI
ncbi:hypothetical protein [Candidatus Cetobacterium colombiensis]|uniref:YkgJ family cysteine cluster protein n=1 Tax=Candidatus Cetobacterium colombiensis TaxID=3073100 RepID=A0ABU4WD24_9FUSO|nr:hypothetical protein [Candidatus Cetobacterium colombiensis]MDX8336609.1 hypothetical protein [Candidatus Cetobacterium colombiensis]